MNVVKYPDRKVLRLGSISVAITIPYEFVKKYRTGKDNQVSIVSKGNTLILKFKGGKNSEYYTSSQN